MLKTISYTLLLILCSFIFASNIYADFDKRYWERYAEINIPPEGLLPPLGGIYLDPGYFESIRVKIPFSDIRIISGNDAEIPYQIIARGPETKEDELSVRMLNLSYTKKKETYFEGFIEKTPIIYNIVEIITNENNFYRQLQIFGSTDGKNWNLLRGDAVIFDYNHEEKLRHSKITLPNSTFRYIGIKIINNNERPLKISSVKVYYQEIHPGIDTPVNVLISKKEDNTKTKETTLIVNLSSFFPVTKLTLTTPDKNFQRKIIIWIKRDEEWIRWTDDVIFNLDTEKIKEYKLDINISEVSAKEMKLVIKNYDSPPVNITGINAIGYKRILIFKLDGRQRYYVFWGNEQAKSPEYDISHLLAKYNIKDLQIFSVGAHITNPHFVGYKKSLPFTERYKYLLYGAIIFLIALLILLQYVVMKKTEK